MKVTTLHHTAGNQLANKPEDIGGNFKFYNYIITTSRVFKQHSELHPRGPFESIDAAMTGNFLKDSPTEFQQEEFVKLAKRLGNKVIPHKLLKTYGATIGTLETECPGNFPPIEWPVSYVAGRDINLGQVAEEIKRFSRDRLKFKFTKYEKSITRNNQVLSGDDMEKIAEELNPGGNVIVFFYDSNTSWNVTTYSVKRNQALVAMPYNATPHTILFELSHAIQKYFNENRGKLAPVQVVDRWPINSDLLFEKYDLICPWLPLLGPVEEEDMELVKLDDSKDIWLVRDGERSLVYNVSAFKLIGGNIDSVKVLTQEQFNIIPDSGLVLASIAQE